MSTSKVAMAPLDRRTKRRQEIVQAATRIFADQGYDNAEMERVAAEIGIAKGTLYLYFGGKQDLFYACVDEGMQQMQRAVQSARDSDGDPFDRISSSIRAYLVFFDEHPHLAELLIQERAIFKDRKRPTYFVYRDASRGAWRELYSKLAEAGRIRQDIPIERMLDTIGSLLYGTMFTNHFVGRTVTLDEQHSALVEIILGGILSDNERSSRARDRKVTA